MAAERAILEPLSSVGVFDSIEYNETELGIGEMVVSYLEGKLSKLTLAKCMAQLTKDRLVIHLLEGYQIKFAPKCIWHEDGKNEYGIAYAGLIDRVSAAVKKGRRNKPRT